MLAAVALVGATGCGAIEQGAEPELVAETAGEIRDLTIAGSSLYWAAGSVQKVSVRGGEVMDLGGQEVCAIATDGRWIYRADGDEIVFTSMEGGEPSLLTGEAYTSGRTPVCNGLALTGDDVFALMGHHDTMLANAPVGVSGAALMELQGDVTQLVADDEAIYFVKDEQLLKLTKTAMEAEVLVDEWAGRRLKLDGSHVYWQEVQSSDTLSELSLHSVPKDGGEVLTITEVEGGCGFFGDYWIDGEYAYFGYNTDRDRGEVACHDDDVVAIAKAPLDGGKPIIISAYDTIDFPEHIVTNDSHVFYTECFGVDDGCRVMSVEK